MQEPEDGHKNGVFYEAQRLSASRYALARDLATHVFPASQRHFNDRIIAGIRKHIYWIIRDIETEIFRHAISEYPDLAPPISMHRVSRSKTYPILLDGGLLQSPQIIEFFYARVSEEILSENVKRFASKEVSPYRSENFLDHRNASVADAAMALLIAENRVPEGSEEALYLKNLPAECAYQLIWRVAAALTHIYGDNDGVFRRSAQDILAHHDEDYRTSRRALRLAYHLNDDDNNIFIDPTSGGLRLFIANLSVRLDSDYDDIIIAAMEPGLPRLIIMMRALSWDAEAAIKSLHLLSAGITQMTVVDFLKVDEENARTQLSHWEGNAEYRRTQQILRPVASLRSVI